MEKTTIPKNAKCVFKGVLFDVFQWQQKQFDGTYKTFEMVRLSSAVQIIAITPEKQIILVKESQPNKFNFISVVGGGIEKDETPQEAAKRELLEELGMICSELVQFDVGHLSSKIDYNCYYFVAKNCKQVQEQDLDSGEMIEPFVVDFDDFVAETQKDEFRNTYLQNKVYRMIHTKGELEKFKDFLFE